MKSLITLIRFTGLFLVLFCVVSLVGASAQATKKPRPQNMNNAPSATAKNPMGCKAGQMRCTTNKDRWAAAAHHADRRAIAMRKHQGQVK